MGKFQPLHAQRGADGPKAQTPTDMARPVPYGPSGIHECGALSSDHRTRRSIHLVV